MAFEFLLPDIGEGLAEAEIVEWFVSEGDTVTMDQVIVAVETDKAVVDIPIPVPGTILHIGGTVGDTLEVGSVLAVVGEAGERWPADVDGAGTVEDTAQLESSDVAPIVGTLDTEVTVLGAASTSSPSPGQSVQAMPVVRKLARDLGVDISQVSGTGPDGRITREDVTAAAGQPETSVAPPQAPGEPEAPIEPEAPVEPDPGEPETSVEPDPGEPETSVEPEADSHHRRGRALSGIRRTIAERVSRSWAEIPHVTAFDEVDATRLLEVKKALTKRSAVPISVDALVGRAMVPVLEEYPDFNARLDGETIIDNESIDVGFAVDAADGLMIVVVRDVARRTLTEIASEVARLSDLAKQRKVTPADMSGQTFTVSNIGAVGGSHGTPIVPYGTTAILSVGRAVERPVARDGKVVVVAVMPLSLSYDHRLIDGGQGRRFLARVVENLAEPALFLAD